MDRAVRALTLNLAELQQYLVERALLTKKHMRAQ